MLSLRVVVLVFCIPRAPCDYLNWDLFDRPEDRVFNTLSRRDPECPPGTHTWETRRQRPCLLISAQESLDSKIRVGYVFANLPLGRQIVISKIVRLFIFLILFIEVRLWLFLGFPVLRPARPFLS